MVAHSAWLKSQSTDQEKRNRKELKEEIALMLKL